VLVQATQEQPVPSLSEIARRVGYQRTDLLYRVDRDLCKQLTAQYRRSGRSHQWRKPGAYRISEHVDLQQVLQQALAQERPPSLRSVAARLGYANAGYLQQKFPALCRALGRKHATRERERRVAMERALSDALRADPVPTLKQVWKQLGYTSASPLWHHFPTQCDKLLARRRAQRAQRILAVRRQLQDWQLEVPAVSLLVAGQRLGLSRTTLREWCPEECAALSAQYIRRRHEASQLRKTWLFAEVQEIVSSLHEHGQCPTVPRVMSLLAPTTVREWKTLAVAVKAARDAVEQHLRQGDRDPAL
jgi:AraC-like DNA-binding protein